MARLTRFRAELLILVTLSACSHPSEQQRRAERERDDRDRSSAAFKAGEAAHEIAKQAERTAAAAERKLEESARKASEGWSQKEREDREKSHR
jgi:hypothetical protein